MRIAILMLGALVAVVGYSVQAAPTGALKRAGKAVELVELKGEDHWLSVGDTRQQMLTRSAEFLGRCNSAQ